MLAWSTQGPDLTLNTAKEKKKTDSLRTIFPIATSVVPNSQIKKQKLRELRSTNQKGSICISKSGTVCIPPFPNPDSEPH